MVWLLTFILNIGKNNKINNNFFISHII
jgi:hypothetical protein